MTSQIDETTSAIKSQISMIQENRKQRNQIYHSCMDKYINNLKNQIQLLQSTEELNNTRNKTISSAFENVYDKILTSANVTLRKIKQTSWEKKVFWELLLKTNPDLNSIELKKSFFTLKRQAQDRYYDAIDHQNAKKIPYSVLLGKNKKKSELQQWKQNNKIFQEKVHQGTTTLNQWKTNWDRNEAQSRQNFYRPMTEVFDNMQPNQFVRTGSQNQLLKPSTNYDLRGNVNKYPSPKSTYEIPENFSSDFGFLKNFQKRK